MIANLTYVEMSVVKATTPTDGPPKRKHTRRLVDETWREPRTCPSECFHALSRCQVLNSPVVALKTLSVAHELMQCGSPAVLPAARDWREHFTMIKTHWAAGAENNAAPLAKVCAPLIAAYAEMLDAKARFHAERPAFENNYSFEQPDENEDARVAPSRRRRPPRAAVPRSPDRDALARARVPLGAGRGEPRVTSRPAARGARVASAGGARRAADGDGGASSARRGCVRRRDARERTAARREVGSAERGGAAVGVGARGSSDDVHGGAG